MDAEAGGIQGQRHADHPVLRSDPAPAMVARSWVDRDLGPGRQGDRQAQAVTGLQSGDDRLEEHLTWLIQPASRPQAAQHSRAELVHGTIGTLTRQGNTQVKSVLIRTGDQREAGPAAQHQRLVEDGAAETGHVTPLVQVGAIDRSGIEAEVAADGGLQLGSLAVGSHCCVTRSCSN